MKTIIVPTDYSAAAIHATDYAGQLAKTLRAGLILLHVFQRPTLISTTLEVNSVNRMALEHEEKLTLLAEQLTETYGIEVDKIATTGHLPEILDELVKQKQAELVVIGMHALSTAERLLVGSTTTTVMEYANYPLLIVPQEATFKPLKHMLLACEYQYLTGQTKLPVLRDLALGSGGEIEVLHIEEPEMVAGKIGERVQTGQYLDRMLKGVAHSYAFVERDDITEGILQRIQTFQADLLALVPREHGIWDILFNRSTTRKLIWQMHIPLLVLPNHA
ncbi:universal stress protein [Rhodocytophaga rosea]|uniref:Universal stress protein n=1 Tax=Rhodocytophaga rosea TaxID=2704465 RepID=A0A6C0GT17_9BACT|nr:universal stress protein [Rhodocytophaga rosea]QHT71311.1 universal stress protein [Rhodocytophaga rosea]